MRYADEGSLKKCLPNIVNNQWKFKLQKSYHIISGLEAIHQLNLIHRDFHDGNILSQIAENPCISDLGLCRPVEYFQANPKKNIIYGVLPFIAPEVLRGKPYTLASDIYSFAMIMWEFTSGVRPFDDKEHGYKLALSICRDDGNGERPKIIENTPQCYIDLMEKCWNADPLKRPTALEVKNLIKVWLDGFYGNIKENFENDIMEFQNADSEQKQIKPIAKSHPEAYHTSRSLDFINELKT